MSEIGSALPYFSAIRITKRPTRRWQPTGYQNPQGQDLYQQVQDLPGIEVEITPYMGVIPGPAMPFKFPLKKFFEDALAELQSKVTKTEEDQAAIENIQATLARTDIIWCEVILQAGGLPSLSDLWAEVYSDALDEFEKWSEGNRGAGGIPIWIKEMQWDIRVPFAGSKAVELKVGLFVNQSDEYTTSINTLLFEDSASSSQRTSYTHQLQQRIADLNAQIDALPEGPSVQRTKLEQERTAYQNELSQRQAVDVTTIGALLGNESVRQNLPVLLMSIVGTLKPIYWPNLDMGLVQTRMAETLSQIA